VNNDWCAAGRRVAHKGESWKVVEQLEPYKLHLQRGFEHCTAALSEVVAFAAPVPQAVDPFDLYDGSAVVMKRTGWQYTVKPDPRIKAAAEEKAGRARYSRAQLSVLEDCCREPGFVGSMNHKEYVRLTGH
jgi:hypothetical protein